MIGPPPSGAGRSDQGRFRRTGIQKETGRILGHYEYTGAVPAFIETLRAAGIPFDEAILSSPAAS